jgi:hypothetical protein
MNTIEVFPDSALIFRGKIYSLIASGKPDNNKPSAGACPSFPG